MADAKIINYGQPIGAGTTAIPDNTSVALEIESTDAKEYITIDTTDGSEKLTIAGGGAAGMKVDFHVGGGLQGRASNTFSILGTGATATAPNFCPSSGDGDTGIGRAAADQLSLIAGGVEGIRITEAVTHASGSIASAVVKIQDAIQYNSGTGSDTATTEAVYLEDTNSHLVIDFANGNFGDVTLAAAIDTVKFLNAPPDGTVATVTAKITQDSSNREIDYSASAVTVYSEDGDTAVTGEVLWSGAAAHVMSTASGAVDLVSFTCIPSGSTFNIYAAVIGQAFA